MAATRSAARLAASLSLITLLAAGPAAAQYGYGYYGGQYAYYGGYTGQYGSVGQYESTGRRLLSLDSDFDAPLFGSQRSAHHAQSGQASSRSLLQTYGAYPGYGAYSYSNYGYGPAYYGAGGGLYGRRRLLQATPSYGLGTYTGYGFSNAYGY